MCIQHHGLKIVFRNPKTSMKKKMKEKKQKLFNKMSKFIKIKKTLLDY